MGPEEAASQAGRAQPRKACAWAERDGQGPQAPRHDRAALLPLTLIDAFSRYLLRCEALLDPDGKHVRSVLDSAFLEFGVPAAIRSDGGPPFASTGPARLTLLSVWLLQLGIRIEIIAPGKPGEATARPFSQLARIDKNGFIQWHRRPLVISSALRHEYIELTPSDDGRRWNVRSGPIRLGSLDEHPPERGLITARRRPRATQVSAMSLR